MYDIIKNTFMGELDNLRTGAEFCRVWFTHSLQENWLYCSCSCPMTGDLTSSTCVCGCMVNGAPNSRKIWRELNLAKSHFPSVQLQIIHILFQKTFLWHCFV